MSQTTLTILGVDYVVDYSFTKGYPATLEEPGYDDKFEINNIELEPSQDNLREYEEFLEEWCCISTTWLESEELHDMILSVLYAERNQYKDYQDSDYWDYDDNLDDVYFN